MDDLKIELTYEPEHFREFYYQQGQDNNFRYKPTRNAILYFGTTAILTFIVYAASFTRPGISWLMVLGFIILLFTGIYAGVEIFRNQKWKNKVEAYLKELGQYKTYNILLTAGTVEVSHDSTTFIEKWDCIKSVQIYNTHIVLNKADEAVFLIPVKSMRPDEFSKLRDFIVNKIRISVEEPLL